MLKAGALDKAMDLCLAGQLFEELRTLAASPDKQQGQLTPSVALRFSDYFLSNAQYDKCVSMLVMAGELERAIAVVSRYKLPMSKALAAPQPDPGRRHAQGDVVRGHVQGQVGEGARVQHCWNF